MTKVSEIDMLSPKTVKECLQILGETKQEVRLLAGGTDAIVRMKEGHWRPDVWINIKGIQELRYIREEADGIHIGPLTTHSDIVHSSLLQEKADVLVHAASEVGALHIRNMGTIGGNLGTASPAGDTLPPLYVLDAIIELSSMEGTRRIPIEEFFMGAGKTVQRKSEIISNIIIRSQEETEIGCFEKLGLRKAQAISIVDVAVSLKMSGNSLECKGGKIAFGSVGPTIIRARKCESLLSLQPLTEEAITNIATVAWKEVAPITDLRASASYRRDMASALLERGLHRLMKRWCSR